jgi:hypothetical protein
LSQLESRGAAAPPLWPVSRSRGLHPSRTSFPPSPSPASAPPLIPHSPIRIPHSVRLPRLPSLAPLGARCSALGACLSARNSRLSFPPRRPAPGAPAPLRGPGQVGASVSALGARCSALRSLLPRLGARRSALRFPFVLCPTNTPCFPVPPGVTITRELTLPSQSLRIPAPGGTPNQVTRMPRRRSPVPKYSSVLSVGTVAFGALKHCSADKPFALRSEPAGLAEIGPGLFDRRVSWRERSEGDENSGVPHYNGSRLTFDGGPREQRDG